MIFTDKEISVLAENDIFFPFVGQKTRTLENGTKALSYGLGHAGYDIRLSPKGMVILDNQTLIQDIEDTGMAPVLDVKDFDEEAMVEAPLIEEQGSSFFILPALSYALGVSIELISMPKNVMGLCFGKSTYARQGTIINVTPIEPGWSGHLTICMVNPLLVPVRVYANEGIVQVVLAPLSEDVAQSYGDGKYQNQGASVTFAAA